MKMYYKLIIACTIASASVACLNIVNSARLSNTSDSRRRSLDRIARRESILANMPEPMANFASQYLDFMNLFSPNDFLLDYYQDYIDVKPEEDREYDDGMFNLTKSVLDALSGSANGSGFEKLLSTKFSDLYSPSTGEELEGSRFPLNALGITPQESQMLLPVAKFNMFSLFDGSGMLSSMQKAGTLTILEDPDNQKFLYETDEDVDKATKIEGLNASLRNAGFPGLAGPKSDVEIFDALDKILKELGPGPVTLETIEELASQVLSGGFPEGIIKKFEEAQSKGDPIIHESLIKSLRLSRCSLPEPNALLANSPWPSTYRDPSVRSSSPAVGPTSYSELMLTKFEKSIITNNPIELLYSPRKLNADGSEGPYEYIWGSSWTSIFRLKRTEKALELAGHIEKNADEVFDDKLHGRHSLITADGKYVTSAKQAINVYEADPSDPNKIVLSEKIDPFGVTIADAASPAPPSSPLAEGEVIKGLAMLRTGEIVYVTSKGIVGLVRISPIVGESAPPPPPPPAPAAYVKLGSVAADDNIDVYTGILAPEDNNIYIASNKYLHKLAYSDTAPTPLSIVAEKPYDKVDPNVTLSKESPRGTKTTPSFMGEYNNGRIVLVDSAPVANLVVFKAETLDLEEREPITFGNKNPKNTVVEHSVLINGWRMAVVNSTPTSQSMGANLGLGRFNFNMGGVMKSGEPALTMVNEIARNGDAPEKLNFHLDRTISNAGMDNPYDIVRDPGNVVNKMKLFGEHEKGVLRAIGAQMDMHNMKEMKMKIPMMNSSKPFSNFLASMPNNGLLSNMMDTTPFGVHQFEYDMSTPSKKIRTTWVNNDVSLPNGIPTVSIPLGIMYGIGKRNPFKRESGPLAGEWTLEAINWDTGKSIFSYCLGGGPWTNLPYGSTQLGPDGEVIAATANGIVSIKPKDATKVGRQFNKAQAA